MVHQENYVFSPGKPDVLINRSSEIVIFATGMTVHRALNVANRLRTDGIEVDIVNVHTFKSVNPEDFYPILKRKRLVLTVEDHNIVGGLGTLMSEMMVECGISAKLNKLGLEDKFGESGYPEKLAEKFGIGESLIESALRKAFREED